MTDSSSERSLEVTSIVAVFDSYTSNNMRIVWIVKIKVEQLRQVRAMRVISRNLYCKEGNTLNLKPLTMIPKRPFSTPVLSNPSQLGRQLHL